MKYLRDAEHLRRPDRSRWCTAFLARVHRYESVPRLRADQQGAFAQSISRDTEMTFPYG